MSLVMYALFFRAIGLGCYILFFSSVCSATAGKLTFDGSVKYFNGSVEPASLPSLYGSYLAGYVALLRGESEVAVDFFREAIASDVSSNALVEQSFLLFLSSGYVADALKLVDRVLLIDNDSSHFARLLLCVEKLKRQQYVYAERELRTVGGLLFGGVPLGIFLAWLKQGQGKFSEALEILDKTPDSEWNTAKNFHAGLIAHLAGDAKEALVRLKIAYEANSSAARISDSYLSILADVKNRDEPGDIYVEHDKFVANDPVLSKRLVSIKSGNYAGSLIAGPTEGIAELLYEIGTVDKYTIGTRLRELFLHLALYLKSDLDFARFALAIGRIQVGSVQHAIAALEQVGPDSRLYKYSRLQIGRCYHFLGEYRRAYSYIEPVFNATKGKDVNTILVFADLLRALKRYPKAVDLYTEAIDLINKGNAPPVWSAFYYRGISYEKSQNWDKAEIDFKRALALNPDEPEVLNYFGYSLVSMGVRLEEALEILKKASKLNPNSGAIMDSLGWAYYQLGRDEEAVDALERAVGLQPSSSIINEHLGDVYWRFGRKREALFQWKRAKSFKLESEDVQRLFEKIRKGLSDHR